MFTAVIVTVVASFGHTFLANSWARLIHAGWPADRSQALWTSAVG
jgi:hypothetical protein